LIDAAVDSAARRGIQAAVIVFDGAQTPGPQTRVQTPAGVAHDAGIGVSEQVGALQEHLSQISQQRDSALRQNEQLSAQIREAQARIAQLEQTPPPPPAAPAPQQPAEMVDHDALSIAVLNLPEKVVKLLAKHEIQTIGQLREFFPLMGDKEHKATQKEKIQTAEALMGRIAVNYDGPPPAAPAPASGPGASDVPTGHSDRPWLDRLKVARFKENKGNDLVQQLQADIAAIAAIVPEFPSEGAADFWAKGLTAVSAITVESQRAEAVALFAAYTGKKVVQEITSSQVAAVIYALGFDPKVSRAVDASLEAAGLVHLVESVPATPAA
jgi:hypothetical protein